MSTKVEATIEDLYKVEGKAELVSGEILTMSPTGKLPGYAGDAITTSLFIYSKRTKYGRAVGDNKSFAVKLPHRKSFSPAAAFYIGDETDVRTKGDVVSYEGAPVFAVEVRSKGDYGPRAERRMAEKRADYFASGTLVIWDVDLESDLVVRVYRLGEPNRPVFYKRGEVAEAEPAVPGWRMPVEDLFPEDYEK